MEYLDFGHFRWIMVLIEIDGTLYQEGESRNFFCKVVLSASESKKNRDIKISPLIFRRFPIETDGPRKLGSRK